MFNAARLKLTIYYLLIIMIISSLFSVVIYRLLTNEFDRILKIEKARMEHEAIFGTFIGQDGTPRRILYINPEVIEESKQRILMMLIAVNVGILTVSSAAGYFLAGRTLKPLKEMVDQQEQFITDASHELRTPLTALKTEIEVALRDPKLSLAESKKKLASNLEEVNALQNLSDSLMKLSQSKQLTGSAFFENVSIKDEITTAMKKVSPLAKNKKITIHLSGKDYQINSEKGNITELLTILLDNAIKYSQKETEVTITTSKSDGYAIIEVTDQGIGISETDLPHLFDRFFRSDNSRTKIDANGFGLGLSIAKKIVDNLGGKIEVDSEENKGTTFTVSLPRIKKQQTH